MRKMVLLVVLLCVSVVLVASVASAASTSQDTKAQTDFHFGTGFRPGFFPYEYHIKVLTEAFKRNGWTIRIDYYPDVQKLIHEVEKGVLDGDAVRSEFFNELHPSPGYVKVDMNWLAGESGAYATRALPVKGLDDLAALNVPIGYTQGVKLNEKALNKIIAPDNLIAFETQEAGFTALSEGKIMIFVALNKHRVRRLLQTDTFKGADIRCLATFLQTKACTYFAKKHAHLAPILANTLRQMKQEGVIDRYLMDSMMEGAAPSN